MEIAELVTIDLDHDSASVAVEIGDETIDRLLPAEMQTFQIVPAQALPQPTFFWSHLAPEFPGAHHLDLIDLLSDDDVMRR